jgi:hypothetical protein
MVRIAKGETAARASGHARRPEPCILALAIQHLIFICSLKDSPPEHPNEAGQRLGEPSLQNRLLFPHRSLLSALLT